MKWQLNIYLCLFGGYNPFWSLCPGVFCFIIFFIHNCIISYPNVGMDKRFFMSWVLHIPHRLSNLLWIVRAWPSVAPIFSSLIMSRASSCVHSSQGLLKVINFLLAQIPWMNESHDLGRPFKVVLTISYSSSIDSSYHRTLPFGVFKDDTWGMRLSLIEYAIILLALALASSPSGS